MLDTAVAPDPAAVRWINPRLRYGEVRKVVTGIPGKTGIVYTLDRETGEFLWGDADGHAERDQQHRRRHRRGHGESGGRLHGQRTNGAGLPDAGGRQGLGGGRLQPQTGLMYFPLRNACARMMATAGSDSVASSLYALAVRTELAPGTDQLGTVQAISPETRRAHLEIRAAGRHHIARRDCRRTRVRRRSQRAVPRPGRRDRGRAVELNLGSPITGFPITFAIEGRQYVAVSTGNSRTVYFAPLTPELRPSMGNNLFVFALPG